MYGVQDRQGWEKWSLRSYDYDTFFEDRKVSSSGFRRFSAKSGNESVANTFVINVEILHKGPMPASPRRKRKGCEEICKRGWTAIFINKMDNSPWSSSFSAILLKKLRATSETEQYCFLNTSSICVTNVQDEFAGGRHYLNPFYRYVGL